MTPLQELQDLIARGELHHVTYRNLGTVWEGLWFYRRSNDGLRGFEVAGAVGKNDPDLEAAEEACRGLGISFGAYGEG